MTQASGQFGTRTVDWHQESLRGCGVEGHSGLCTRRSLNPSWNHRRMCGEKNVKKGRTERRFRNQTISHFMCGSPPLPISSPSHSLPLFLSLIGAHSLVFHHTYPHLNFTNPIYCYLYPWLLLSLLLLLLLLWLELLSLRAIFSFYFHGFKYWFAEQGGCLGNKRH